MNPTIPLEAVVGALIQAYLIRDIPAVRTYWDHLVEIGAAEEAKTAIGNAWKNHEADLDDILDSHRAA